MHSTVSFPPPTPTPARFVNLLISGGSYSIARPTPSVSVFNFHRRLAKKGSPASTLAGSSDHFSHHPTISLERGPKDPEWAPREKEDAQIARRNEPGNRAKI